MRTWIITLCTTCILQCVGYSSNSLNHLLVKGDSLYESGLFEEAALAYERVVFDAGVNDLRTTALIKKAKCLEAKSDYKQAAASILRVNFFGLSDSLQFEARYAAAFYSYLSEDFEQAESQLLLIDQFLPEEYGMKVKPLHALTLNELRKWNEAKQQLNEWVQYTYQNAQSEKDSLSNKLDELYIQKKQPKYRDPDRALLWASILPGTGQLYSWYPFDAAFTALMVLSGIGIAAYGVFVIQYYVTGILVGYGVFQQFYASGQRRSEYLAKKRNYKSKRKYNEELQDFILQLS